MYAIPGLLALLSFIYLRPQEIAPALQSVPFLYVFLLLTVVGFALDVRLGITRLQGSPVLLWAAIYFGWSMMTLVVSAPVLMLREVLLSFVSFFLFLAASQAVQHVNGVRIVATTLLALSLVMAVVGVHQAFAPLGCVKQDDALPQVWHPDGRSCTERTECSAGALDDESRYRCEHLGMFGTISVEGRVRYRGVMEDPNELAMVLAIALPFAFAGYQSRRTWPRLLLAVGAVGLFGVCTIYTRSRSGQLAFLAVLASYLLRRIGWRGLAMAALLGAPVLFLGGRTDAGADQSTQERIDCWSRAIELFRSAPLLGVGKGQFTEHHWLTAHNSFLLALAELGFPGLFFFTAVIYLAFRSAHTAGKDGDPTTQIWGNALFSSLCALMVSAYFLSLTDHNVTWTLLGLACALSTALARSRGIRLAFTRRDALWVGAIDVGIILATFVYTRLKGA
jgi:O-antigen ligase